MKPAVPQMGSLVSTELRAVIETFPLFRDFHRIK